MTVINLVPPSKMFTTAEYDEKFLRKSQVLLIKLSEIRNPKSKKDNHERFQF